MSSILSLLAQLRARSGGSLASIKYHTYDIIEVADENEPASKAFDIFILSLIVLNVVAVLLETVPELNQRYATLFAVFDTFSVIVFTIEYILRLWSCTIDARYKRPLLGRLRFAVTPLALIDLLAIVPFYLPLLLSPDLRFLRGLRLLRLFRLFKAARYLESLRIMGVVLRTKKEELLSALSMVLILLVFAASFMYYIEHEAQPEAFSSIPAAMWWGIATLTTVGYGDVYPITPLGKFFGAIIAVLGIGMFALPAGILASGFSEALQQREQDRRCPHCGEKLTDAG